MDEQERIPRHVGIIMDGNGRWAESRGKTRSEGHRAGYENGKKLIHFVFEQGVEVLTVFAFSTENWERDPEEIECLLDIFREATEEFLPRLAKENIRVKFIGDRSRLPEDLQEMMARIEADSNQNTEGTFVPAISYGGRDEITRAVRKIVERGFAPDDITEELIAQHLDTADLGDLAGLDLIIRTSGEQRISNFLIWQGAYAELYTTPTYWPDFGEEDFLAALADYGNRDRRFGRVIGS